VVDRALLDADEDHDERRIRTLRNGEKKASVGHSGEYSPTRLTMVNNNTESRMVKPGSGNTRNAEMRYRICGQCGKSCVSECVLPVCSDTHPIRQQLPTVTFDE